MSSFLKGVECQVVTIGNRQGWGLFHLWFFFGDSSVRHLHFYWSFSLELVTKKSLLRTLKNLSFVSSMFSACSVAIPPCKSYAEDCIQGCDANFQHSKNTVGEMHPVE